MKHGKNPTANQRKIIQKNSMDPCIWLVSKVEKDHLLCLNRYTYTERKAFYEVQKV
ncbi:hypothetical protein D3C76_986910 [compost metagenome]